MLGQLVLLFFIHGDANYLYHDTLGVAHMADMDALTQAKAVAESNLNSEVFVFHDKPLQRKWLFFKQHDGEFFHYKNGVLEHHVDYWRDEGTSRFSTQADLFKAYCKEGASRQQRPINIALYFGHEIPEAEGVRYDDSYPDSVFSIKKFARELNLFVAPSTARDKPFDVIVMSTCYSGTPFTIDALSSVADYVVASPDNLHLSYMDVNALKRPIKNLESRMESVSDLANTIAVQSFNKLSASVQTGVTIGVYDVGATSAYTHSVADTYQHTLDTVSVSHQFTYRHCDCSDDSQYIKPGIEGGHVILYRPPLFGRESEKIAHSGWSCWRMLPKIHENQIHE